MQYKKKRTKQLTTIIRNEGMQPILYTGPFGKDKYKQYAQRDKDNNPLSLMCPSSKYIENILLPELHDVLQYYDGLFLDMPWIMKNGCHCNNCDGNNQQNVRNAIQKIRHSVKRTLSINAGAPTIHNEFPSGHILNLNGLCDEYVTEWNPLRWNQNPCIVNRVITYAKKTTNKKVYHATTCTDRSGNIYPAPTLAKLLSAIAKSGATPRLALGFNEKGLEIVKNAIRLAEEQLID